MPPRPSVICATGPEEEVWRRAPNVPKITVKVRPLPSLSGRNRKMWSAATDTATVGVTSRVVANQNCTTQSAPLRTTAQHKVHNSTQSKKKLQLFPCHLSTSPPTTLHTSQTLTSEQNRPASTRRTRHLLDVRLHIFLRHARCKSHRAPSDERYVDIHGWCLNFLCRLQLQKHFVSCSFAIFSGALPGKLITCFSFPPAPSPDPLSFLCLSSLSLPLPLSL